MATMIFDKENRDVAPTILSKNCFKQTSSAKSIFKINPGKVFSSSGTVVRPRKALGNVNKQVVCTAVPQQKGAPRVKKSALFTKQISKACVKTIKPSYPEIEKYLPYDPADFETFDVPEDHKLSHLYLAGVPLIVHENIAAELDSLLAKEPAPMDCPVFTWESDVSSTIPSFLATIEIALDLPQMISEACVKPSKQSYPEIDKCLPYDPADFEIFDVPEEHKLSHLYLAGVPLIVYENGAAKFDALLTKEPAPMDIPIFTWESDASSTIPTFLATIEEITCDLSDELLALF